ncbi:MAG: Wzz/FepE/Etk N-terminal domain-containing protein [Candidatus Cloacimonadota bacterium]
MNYETNLAKELDLHEIIRCGLKNRRLILAIVSITAIAAVIYSLLTPEIWSSEATFYALSDKKMEFSLANSDLSSLVTDLMQESAQNDVMISLSILGSRTMSEDVIRHFDLIRYFKLAKSDSLVNLDIAIKKLSKMVKISYDEESFLVTLRVETKSKSLSQRIAAYYLARLDDYLQNESMVKGKRNRIFLEQRITEVRAEMDSLQMAISSFKSEHKAVDLQQQSQELISQYSGLLAQKMKLEIDLVLARESYAQDSPLVAGLERQISETTRQIQDLESSHREDTPLFRLDLEQIPSLSAQLTRLELQASVLNTVHNYMLPHYEDAVMEEQKSMPRLEIVDHPREAGRRVRPRRAIICLVSTIVAGFMALFIALIKESFSAPSQPQV